MHIDINCKYCNKIFNANTNEIKRGWGIFCSKSCAVSFRYKDKELKDKCTFDNYDHIKNKFIPLTQGQYALIDVENYDILSKFKWKAVWCSHSKQFRAARSIRLNGKQKTIYMHRDIVLLNDNDHVDHINHNTLDNRKSNLRAVTNSVNHKNTRMRSDNTSGVCGVSWSKKAGKWQSQIMSCGKYMHLGYFSNLFDAVCIRKSYEILHNFHVNHGKRYYE